MTKNKHPVTRHERRLLNEAKKKKHILFHGREAIRDQESQDALKSLRNGDLEG